MGVGVGVGVCRAVTIFTCSLGDVCSDLSDISGLCSVQRLAATGLLEGPRPEDAVGIEVRQSARRSVPLFSQAACLQVGWPRYIYWSDSNKSVKRL